MTRPASTGQIAGTTGHPGEDIVGAVLAANRERPGALLPILHAIQERLGYIPGEAIPRIAGALRQTRAEIAGVISFYADFRREPPGRHIIQICRAEACQAVGSRALEAHVQTRLGVGYHQTTPDARLTLEPVYCLGNCACGPSLRIDDSVYGRVGPGRFDQLMAALPEPVRGPQG